MYDSEKKIQQKILITQSKIGHVLINTDRLRYGVYNRIQRCLLKRIKNIERAKYIPDFEKCKQTFTCQFDVLPTLGVNNVSLK